MEWRGENCLGQGLGFRAGDRKVPVWVRELSAGLDVLLQIWHCCERPAVLFSLIWVIYYKLSPQVSIELHSRMQHWMFHQTSESGKTVHLENPQKTVNLSFLLMLHFWVQVNWEPTIAFMHILIWFGIDGSMTSRVTVLLVVSFPLALQWQRWSKAHPIQVILCSGFCSLGTHIAHTFQKCRQPSDIFIVSITLTLTCPIVWIIASTWLTAISVVVVTWWPGLSLLSCCKCLCTNFWTHG